jgi:hypothetical protein
MKKHLCKAENAWIEFEKECNWCGDLESQEPVSDDIASILACRDMLDAQPVPTFKEKT